MIIFMALRIFADLKIKYLVFFILRAVAPSGGDCSPNCKGPYAPITKGRSPLVLRHTGL